MEHGDGASAHGQGVAVALLDGVGEVAVLDPAAVDGHGHVVPVRPVQVRIADVAGDVGVIVFEQDGQHFPGHVVAHDAEDGLVELAGAVGAEGFVTVVVVRERDVGVCHGVACDDALHLTGFGGLRAQELEPCGLVAEEVLDRDAGANGGAGRSGLVLRLAVPDAVSAGGFSVGGASYAGQDGHGGD